MSQHRGVAKWTATAFAAACLLSSSAAVAQKHLAPIPAATVSLMAQKGTSASAPILIRTFKKESELEVWKLATGGRYVLLKTFPICRWSGTLGPKTRVGDRQTPEGFYAIAPRQMNPNSAYYLSFDTGYPNAFDRAHGRTGSALMVHGTCSSMGCFAMTDEQVGEVYALAREAFAGGQSAFQFQAFPFRMTAANMARYRQDPHIDFWRQLKEGSDRFEATGEEPLVAVRDGRYAFGPNRNAAREALAQSKLADEKEKVAKLVEEGIAAIRTTYSDGGQHPTFAALVRRGLGASLGTISRPEALAWAGRDITVIPARRKAPATMLADALPPPRDPSFAGLAAAPRLADLSVFSWMPLGYAAGSSAVSVSLMAGSARILPATLAGSRFDLALR